jgi:hypothetical protein
MEAELNLEKLKAELAEFAASGGHPEVARTAEVILNGLRNPAPEASAELRLGRTLAILRGKASGRGKVGPAYRALSKILSDNGVAEVYGAPR